MLSKGYQIKNCCLKFEVLFDNELPSLLPLADHKSSSPRELEPGITIFYANLFTQININIQKYKNMKSCKKEFIKNYDEKSISIKRNNKK